MGKFNGVKLEWFRNEDEDDPAISYLWVPKKFSFIYQTGHFRRREMVDWLQTRHFIIPQDTSVEVEWTIEGSVPLPLAVMSLLFSKMLLL